MTCSRIIGGLAAALVVALLLPAAASAKTYPVSRDVGVYSKPDLSTGVGVIKAGRSVNVDCWTTGPAVAGYAIWDRIVGHPSGVAYVHDRYVEMPKGSPQAEGIPQCPAGGGQPSKPPVNTCVRGDYAERYLSAKRPLAPDHSYVRLTWHPRMCLRTDGWELQPGLELADTGAGDNTGIGLELSAPRPVGSASYEYHGRIRHCIPLTIGYSVRGVSIGFTGSGCNTIGTIKVRLHVRNGRAVPEFPNGTANGNAWPGTEHLWTRGLI
jgi:hypothetical protein